MTTPSRRWLPRLPRLRFSLRTLLLLVLLIGAGGGMWWRWEPWVFIRRFTEPTGFVNNSMLTPDGKRLLLVGVGHETLWDVETGRLLIEAEGGVSAVSPDSACLLISNSGMYARAGSAPVPIRPPQLVDAATGKVRAELKGLDTSIYMAEFSPGSRQVVTACVDGTAAIWDVNTAALLQLLRGHAGNVYSARWSPDGKRIATASFDHTARIWDAESGTELHCLNGHEDQVLEARYFKSGKRLWTMSWVEHACRVWDAESGQCISVLSPVSVVRFSPDEKTAVSADWKSGVTTTFDVETGHTVLSLPGERESGHVDSAEFSPDGARILAGSTDRCARVWDASSGLLRTTIGELGESDIPGAHFSPDGTQVLTWRSAEACIWDAESGRRLRAFQCGKRMSSFIGANRLFLADEHGHAEIWERRRPEYWWGPAGLPEFWLTALLFAALVWSVVKDRRSERRG